MSHPAVLTIRLDRLRENYKTLQRYSGVSRMSAVVKANAYGLGVAPVVKTLSAMGNSLYFVAYPEEGAIVRDCLHSLNASAQIFVLNGFNKKSERLFAKKSLTPVLNSAAQIQLFQNSACYDGGAALQLDSGMHRCGIERSIARNGWQDLPFCLILSHLACADTPNHPLNAQQIAFMEQAKTWFPNIPISLAASNAILNLPHSLFDLVRPGAALYGAIPHPEIKAVVHLHTEILEIRNIQQGDSVGYGADYTAPQPQRIATIALGYADGYKRALGNVGSVTIGGYVAPVIGRISMDVVTVDVSAIPEYVAHEQAIVTILDDHFTVNDLAAQAGTIGYEILTSLGTRYQRRYIEIEDSPP